MTSILYIDKVQRSQNPIADVSNLRINLTLLQCLDICFPKNGRPTSGEGGYAKWF